IVGTPEQKGIIGEGRSTGNFEFPFQGINSGGLWIGIGLFHKRSDTPGYRGPTFRTDRSLMGKPRLPKMYLIVYCPRDDILAVNIYYLGPTGGNIRVQFLDDLTFQQNISRIYT